MEVNNLSRDQYCVSGNIKFKAPTPRSNLCNCSNAYITIKWRITVTVSNNANRRNKLLTLNKDVLFK